MERQSLGRFTLNVPGPHNIINSLAAVAVGLTLGVPFPQIADGLAELHRHGPTLRAAGGDGLRRAGHRRLRAPSDRDPRHPRRRPQAYPDRRIVAVFQPHLPSRTQDFKGQFAESFADADFAVLTDIYLAREQPIEGVTGAGLAALTADRRGAEHVAYVGDKALPGRLSDMVCPATC